MRSSPDQSFPSELQEPVRRQARRATQRARLHTKVVQERLGHSSISITLDTYSHVTAGLHGDAAERVAGLVLRALAIR